MPATNAWDETKPAGSDLASTIDNQTRQLKLDVRERLAVQHYWNDSLSTDGIHKEISITPAAANTELLKTNSNQSVTGANTTPAINLGVTWNTTGAPTALKINVTNTASDAASLLIDLQVGGVSQFKVSKAGLITTTGGYNPTGLITAAGGIRITGGTAGATGTIRFTANTVVMEMGSGGFQINDSTNTAARLSLSDGGALTGVMVDDGNGLNINPSHATFTSAAIHVNTVRAANSAFRLLFLRANSVTQFSVNGAGAVDASGKYLLNTWDVLTFSSADLRIGGTTGSQWTSIGFYSGATRFWEMDSSGRFLSAVYGDIAFGWDTNNGFRRHLSIADDHFWYVGGIPGFEVLKNSSAGPSIRVPTGAYGAAKWGGNLILGRNTSGSAAAGYIEFIDKGGTSRYVWVDNAGKLRIHTSAPVEDGGTTSDTAGTVVGTQT